MSDSVVNLQADGVPFADARLPEQLARLLQGALPMGRSAGGLCKLLPDGVRVESVRRVLNQLQAQGLVVGHHVAGYKSVIWVAVQAPEAE